MNTHAFRPGAADFAAYCSRWNAVYAALEGADVDDVADVSRALWAAGLHWTEHLVIVDEVVEELRALRAVQSN